MGVSAAVISAICTANFSTMVVTQEDGDSGGSVARRSPYVGILVAGALLPFYLPVVMGFTVVAVSVGFAEELLEEFVDRPRESMAGDPTGVTLVLLLDTDRVDMNDDDFITDPVRPIAVDLDNTSVDMDESPEEVSDQDAAVENIQRLTAGLYGVSYADARADLLNALKLQPRNPVLWCKLAIATTMMRGSWVEIKSYLDNAQSYRSVSNKAEVDYMIALSLASMGYCRMALDHCESATSESPGYQDAIVLMAAIARLIEETPEFCKQQATDAEAAPSGP